MEPAAAHESGQLALKESESTEDQLKFRSAEDIIAYTEGLPHERRYGAICYVLENLTSLYEGVGIGIEKIFEYAKEKKIYLGQVTEEEFRLSWAGIPDVIKLNKKNRDTRKEVMNYIQDRWLDQEAQEWLAQPDLSISLLKAVQKASRTMSFRVAVGKVNAAAIRRVGTPRRGISAARRYVTGDWVDALKDQGGSEPVGAEELRRAGMGIGRFGLVCPASEALHVGEDAMECDSPRATGEGDFPTPDREIGSANMELPASRASSELSDLDSPTFDRMDEELKGGREDAGRGENAEEVDVEGGRSLSESAHESGRDSESESEAAKPGKCKCSRDVTRSWQKKVLAKKAIYTHEALTLLEKWAHFESVCYPHAFGLGACLGLIINDLSMQELRQRLTEVYEHRLEIGKLKTDAATFNWFRRSHRPSRPSDSLGSYKFMPQPARAFDYDQSILLGDMPDKGISERWSRDGTVITDIFSWWFGTPIGEIVLSEFDMYHFHLRSINGRSNWGWLRNMFHSIGQQLIRQDPSYYILYAALRPDKHWRLVSYPYYAKFAKTGDSTYFRHIDLNVPDLLAQGRGSSQIQGAVSLDDETADNCTVLLPGMHRRLADWWELCSQRGAKPHTFVHRLTEKMYTKEDAERFGIYWTSVPCQRGQVRVTLPHIPHGSHGPATGTRRTMLPWFVGLQDDLSTLEVAEAGTWHQLRDAHMSLSAGPASPSGFANRYGVILFRFPAAVEIGTLGGVSDALVCRLPWNSPRVERDRDILLGTDRSAAHTYIRDWRARAVSAAQETMQLVRRKEMEAFGTKSYFYHWERLQIHGIGIPELADDEDEQTAEDGSTDTAGDKFEFAEQDDTV